MLGRPFLVPLSLERRFWIAPVVLLVLTLGWDASGLDLTVMQWLASEDGFPWRHHPLLEEVLHNRARQFALAGFLGAALSAAFPWGPLKQLSGRQRFEAVTGALLGLLAVSLIKHNSLTSCPWDLQSFGGRADYVSHWAWIKTDGGPGRCFPGGHASGAFALLALAWPWFDSSQPQHRALGCWIVVLVVMAGLSFGSVQTLRGAHYPSHTLWTALICWVVSWGWHWALSRPAAPALTTNSFRLP
jgi:membrane-associated PAP2 superfamily phosphatase